MAFWGIEVKAGKPYTHLYDKERGRLRISQAALGIGKSTNTSSLQINVGNQSPILLCNLIPNVLETCHLELEFEEAEEVIFSVLGQRSVHLSGYYIGSSVRKFDGDDTDSYGEDIAETDSSGSYNRSDNEEKYESDFIDDDDDIELSPSSTRRKSDAITVEISEDDKPSKGSAKHQRLKKKHQLSDSDDNVGGSQGLVGLRGTSAVLESEDEDCFPISFSSRRKNKINDSEDDKAVDEDGRKAIEAITKDSKSTRGTCHPCDTSMPSNMGQEKNVKSKKKKKKAKDEKPLDAISKMPAAEERENVEPDKDQGGKEVGVLKENGAQFTEANEESKIAEAYVTGTDGKGKKKSKKGRTPEAAIEVTNEADSNDKTDQDPAIRDQMEKLPYQSEVAVPSALSAKPLDAISTMPAEERENVEPDKDQGDKELGILKENRVQSGEANEESKIVDIDGIETDGKDKKKKNKSKKGKASKAAIEGTNEADGNDKMDQVPAAREKMENLPYQSEVDILSVLSAKPLDAISKMPAEERENVEPDKDQGDKEGGVLKENGVQSGEANDESKTAGVDGTETDRKDKKKMKSKKGKTPEAATEGTNEADSNDKMDQDPAVSTEMKELPNESEVDVPSLLTASIQETSGKLKKKSRKRAKDDRGSEVEGGEVADVDQTGARKKKKKKEKKHHDKDLASS